MDLLTLRSSSLALLGAGLLQGCAHAPPPPPVDAPTWPPPPAAPLVRWAGSFPDERFAPAGPSPLRQVLDAILGFEPEKSQTELLKRPFGLAAIEGGFVVADPDAQAVLRVDWRRGRFDQVTCAGQPWQMPVAVASTAEGDLYVADGAAGVVVRVDARGACHRIGAGQLVRPSGVAVADGKVYVVDPPRHEVVVFLPDGREQLRFGRDERGGEALHYPTGIAVTLDGTLLVVDTLHFRVARFSREGQHLSSFGEAGDGEGAFGRPKGIAVDSEGQLYVTDAQHDVVLLFSPSGSFLLAVGGSGAGPGGLSLPAGVATRDGYLYVANSYGRRVEIFVLPGQGTP